MLWLVANSWKHMTFLDKLSSWPEFFLSHEFLTYYTSVITCAGSLWGGEQSGVGRLEWARVNVGFKSVGRRLIWRRCGVSMAFSQIFQIDIRPLTIYCKGILCWKKNALLFAVASLEGCSAELTSGSSVLKVLLTSLLLRSWEINSFRSQC